MQRLLVLSCSARKRRGAQMMPALERYDGPLFQVARKYLRACPEAKPLRVCVLSAQFGLLDGSTPTPFYDCRMSAGRAASIREASLGALKQVLTNSDYAVSLWSLGHDYWPALTGWKDLVPPRTEVSVASGSVGRRAALLREWLWGQAESTGPSRAGGAPSGTARLCGGEWSFKAEEVLALAHKRLSHDQGEAERFHSWHVPIGGRSVAPKWLVSQVTGLPVSRFSTDQARRALEAWGVEVERQSLLGGPIEG